MLFIAYSYIWFAKPEIIMPIIQVAIVDDHTLGREGLISLLNCTGDFNVCMQAGNGNEFLDKIAHSTFLPDVCLLDINMPEMDGFETMRVLNKKYPKVNCIILTMHDARDVILRTLKYGAKGFLNKNCTAQVLMTAITEVYTNEVK